MRDKRVGHVWDKVVAFDNLCEAARKTCRGQKGKPAVARFYFHQETELLRLQAELVNESYRPSPFRIFWIYEPKPRQICAAPVRDRLVQHPRSHL